MIQLTSDNFNNQFNIDVDGVVILYIKQNNCPACDKFNNVYIALENQNAFKGVTFTVITFTNELRRKASNRGITIDSTPMVIAFNNRMPLAKYTGEYSLYSVTNFINDILTKEIKSTKVGYMSGPPNGMQINTPLMPMQNSVTMQNMINADPYMANPMQNVPMANGGISNTPVAMDSYYTAAAAMNSAQMLSTQGPGNSAQTMMAGIPTQNVPNMNRYNHPSNNRRSPSPVNNRRRDHGGSMYDKTNDDFRMNGTYFLPSKDAPWLADIKRM